MIYKIIILSVFIVSLALLETNALKSIKREDSRINHDFVMLHMGKEDKQENSNKTNVKVSDGNQMSINKENRKFNRPLTEILLEKGRKLHERQREDHNLIKGAPSEVNNLKSELANNNEKTSEVINEHNDNLLKHKNKHLPHSLHSTSLMRAYGVLPPQPVIQSFGEPYPSLEQLIKFGNMLMFKVDAVPYNSQVRPLPYSPKTISNGPNYPHFLKEPYFFEHPNEANIDNIFNVIDGPQENVHPKILNQQDDGKTKPAFEDDSMQLANLMKTALDTLLTSEEDQKINEIELKCPIHHEKKSTQIGVSNDGDVIQVCSCRFIKKDKEALKPLK